MPDRSRRSGLAAFMRLATRNEKGRKKLLTKKIKKHSRTPPRDVCDFCDRSAALKAHVSLFPVDASGRQALLSNGSAVRRPCIQPIGVRISVARSPASTVYYAGTCVIMFSSLCNLNARFADSCWSLHCSFTSPLV